MVDYANTYAEMYDNELLSLAAEPDSLTESARIVLFGELSRRGLGENEIQAWQHSSVDAAQVPKNEKKEMTEELGGHPGSWSMFGQSHLKHLEQPETKESLGSEDEEIAREKLEELYVDQDKLAEAEPLLQRSLAIWQKVFGPEHPNVAQSLSLLAVLYNAQGEARGGRTALPAGSGNLGGGLGKEPRGESWFCGDERHELQPRHAVYALRAVAADCGEGPWVRASRRGPGPGELRSPSTQNEARG